MRRDVPAPADDVEKDDASGEEYPSPGERSLACYVSYHSIPLTG